MKEQEVIREWNILIGLFRATNEQTNMLTGQTKREAAGANSGFDDEFPTSLGSHRPFTTFTNINLSYKGSKSKL